MKRRKSQLTPELNTIKIVFDSMFITKIHNSICTTTLFEDFLIAIIEETSFSKNEIYLIDSLMNKCSYLSYLEILELYFNVDISNKDKVYIFDNDFFQNIGDIGELAKKKKINTCIVLSIALNEKITAVVSLFGKKSNLADINNRSVQIALRETLLKLINNILNYIKSHKKPHCDADNDILHLTSVEIDILRYSADGFTSKEIAHKISLSKSGVDFHLVSLKNKLKCRNKTQVIAKAISLCLI
ncbi:helix-turn-helix transcriptional regulator [Yersinia enterocolitica]